jgi:hypothetical protein
MSQAVGTWTDYIKRNFKASRKKNHKKIILLCQNYQITFHSEKKLTDFVNGLVFRIYF